MATPSVQTKNSTIATIAILEEAMNKLTELT
jgi:hypothetical protein